MRVLVIDDNRGAVLSLQKLLQKNGHKVWTAISGHEGLQCLKLAEFDLVFVDYYIGDMNALDFLSAYEGRAPVILVSGDPHHHDMFFAVLEKPYTEAQLLAVIQEVLQ